MPLKAMGTRYKVTIPARRSGTRDRLDAEATLQLLGSEERLAEADHAARLHAPAPGGARAFLQHAHPGLPLPRPALEGLAATPPDRPPRPAKRVTLSRQRMNSRARALGGSAIR